MQESHALGSCCRRRQKSEEIQGEAVCVCALSPISHSPYMPAPDKIASLAWRLAALAAAGKILKFRNANENKCARGVKFARHTQNLIDERAGAKREASAAHHTAGDLHGCANERARHRRAPCECIFAAISVAKIAR